jgi:hypothetical protein
LQPSRQAYTNGAGVAAPRVWRDQSSATRTTGFSWETRGARAACNEFAGRNAKRAG